ncbi:17077_t:CDS:2 [Gigaspora margarita]|uniref:17077_t:CDS:1 n=1 Tax=Gigaspora margarita TaxID=4874 RepID=A0ABN7WY59_GIGMA|nr:17077_t:CDS:2 [Gigaspora margarita]
MKQLARKLKRKDELDKKIGKQYGYEVPTFIDSKHGKALIDQIKTVDKKRLMKKLGKTVSNIRLMGILKEKRTSIKTPKIIACLSQKGGGGKSTLARAIAVELTKQKFNTLLVDLDIQQKTSQE